VAGTRRTARPGNGPLPWEPAPDRPQTDPLLPWLPMGSTSVTPPRRGLLLGAAPRLVALLTAGALVLAVLVAAAVHTRLAGRTVSTPFLSYTAPPGWTPEPSAPAPAPLETPVLTGAVHGPGYTCDGEAYVRGFAAVAFLPTGPDAGSGPADPAQRLARRFAADSFTTPDGAPPEVTVAAPRTVLVQGSDGPVDGTVVEAAVRAAPAHSGCAATSGIVRVVAAPASGGAALLLVAGDTGGGPVEPGPPEQATLDAVLGSVRLAGT